MAMEIDRWQNVGYNWKKRICIYLRKNRKNNRTYRGHSCLFIFPKEFELAPSPQTTLESTVITGNIFEHVEQVGRPCLGADGTGGFRGTLDNSAMDGRERRLRLSGSSLLIFGSFLDEPL